MKGMTVDEALVVARQEWDTTEALAVLAAEVESLRTAVERVRELHVVYPPAPEYDPYCGECGHDAGWPCPTIRALDG